MPAEQLAREDLAVAEQRREVRIVVSIPGRYSLADLRDARGERRVFACRAVNLSAQSIALAAPVNGKIGAPAEVGLVMERLCVYRSLRLKKLATIADMYRA